MKRCHVCKHLIINLLFNYSWRSNSLYCTVFALCFISQSCDTFAVHRNIRLPDLVDHGVDFLLCQKAEVLHLFLHVAILFFNNLFLFSKRRSVTSIVGLFYFNMPHKYWVHSCDYLLLLFERGYLTPLFFMLIIPGNPLLIALPSDLYRYSWPLPFSQEHSVY